MMRFLRCAAVIARRDFSATVLSKAFIFFLLAPLFPLLMGGVFGGIGSRIATQKQRAVVAVVASPEEFGGLQSARDRMAQAVGDDTVVKLVGYPPDSGADDQVKHLLASRSPPVRAVLYGGLDHPRLVGALASDPATVHQVSLLISSARSDSAGNLPDLDVNNVTASTGTVAEDQSDTAQIAQVVLFLLTLMLSTMVLSQLIEEKSNKVIEIIAAAMPVDAMFVGKLFAMLAASILGLVVWIGSGALLIQLVTHGGVATLPVPAVGWPAFLMLAILYFAMNYLLFGAVFLMIGAQASTARQVQTMSMPVTFGQVLVFGFAATAIGNPDSIKALGAAAFPLSSPMTMIARAAEQPALWPHCIALVWQALWVALILRFGAQLFRRTVLKSGPRQAWWRLGRA